MAELLAGLLGHLDGLVVLAALSVDRAEVEAGGRVFLGAAADLDAFDGVDEVFEGVVEFSESSEAAAQMVVHNDLVVDVFGVVAQSAERFDVFEHAVGDVQAASVHLVEASLVQFEDYFVEGVFVFEGGESVQLFVHVEAYGVD